MLSDPERGKKVRVARLGDTRGMLIHRQHLECRKEGITGSLVMYVAGHGGDVWFVKHDGTDEVGAYALSELDEIPTVH